jgi:8-oxo-dGTP pyrophosphatase MutT (NUDIX family)
MDAYDTPCVPPKEWPLVSTETLLSLRVFELKRNRARSPRTGAEHDFYVLSGRDWCNVVPLTDDGEVVLIRQFRHGTRETTLEIPGGIIDPGDPSPAEAARRELLEETGCEANILESIGVIAPNPAVQSNACYSFVARGVKQVAAPKLDAAEDIEVVRVPLDEIPQRIAAGEVRHALVVVAFAWLLGLRTPVGSGT